MMNPFKKNQTKETIELNDDEDFALTMTRDEFANLATFLGSASSGVLRLYGLEELATAVWLGFEVSGLSDEHENCNQGNIVFVPWTIMDAANGVVW